METQFIVVSISIQPILSVAVRYEMNPNEAASRLAGYFYALGADMVVDMTIADDLALLESQKEFISRYRSKEKDGLNNVLPMLASSCPGIVLFL